MLNLDNNYSSIGEAYIEPARSITTDHSAKQYKKVLHIQVSARDESRMAEAEMSCMAGAEFSYMAGAEVFHMVGDGDVL